MAGNLVLSDKTDPAHWVITLNRPEKRNALSDALVGELLDCLADARQHDIPVLSLRGEGVNFSAGFDFSDFDEVSNADLLWRFVRVQQLLSSVLTYPGLTIAGAHGRNFGAGCDLFAACKVRLASPEARFRMPGVLFGLILGTRHLGQLVGHSHAQRILLSTKEFDIQEALQIGFVTDALPEASDASTDNASMITAVAKLAPVTRHAIIDTLTQDFVHEDMGRLVASVMQGDIKERLARYLSK